MKKTIAKHILGLIGVGILWVILTYLSSKGLVRLNRYVSVDFLMPFLLTLYIVISSAYWAVKTIWFTKDKD